MIDITDKSRQPSIDELADYISNPLFPALCAHMADAHKALLSVDYSGDRQLLGWNLRFRKGSRSLLRLYPRHGCFAVLLVVGRREKARVEALLPGMSEAMRDIYAETKEGMGQRWLLIELGEPGALYNDVLELVRIRRES